MFFATGLGAVSGIGGGVIIKPLMDAITDLSPSEVNQDNVPVDLAADSLDGHCSRCTAHLELMDPVRIATGPPKRAGLTISTPAC